MAAPAKPAFVMKRYEMKYILNPLQREYLIKKLEGHMKVDKYGLTSIESLYYDTPDYRLIRNSLEKPEFKEKMRLRSYGIASENSPVFLEIIQRISIRITESLMIFARAVRSIVR